MTHPLNVTRTHTYVFLDVSRSAFREISKKLEDADYGHALRYDSESRTIAIDMHGLALRCLEPLEPPGEERT